MKIIEWKRRKISRHEIYLKLGNTCHAESKMSKRVYSSYFEPASINSTECTSPIRNGGSTARTALYEIINCKAIKTLRIGVTVKVRYKPKTNENHHYHEK